MAQSIPADRVQWCLTRNCYADAYCATNAPHDHHDVAVDDEGKPLWRLDPIGTTYLMPDGSTLRLVAHDDSPFSEPPLTEELIPRYDYWSPMGGAAGHLRVEDGTVWVGDRLAPGVSRVVLVEQQRPAVGSLYVRPNGEAWRLTGWTSMTDQPQWSLALPHGAMTTAVGEVLPNDARLVWTP